MATPVVLTTGARPITPVESGGVPMTPVDTLGEPVTVVDALGEPVVLINNDGTPAFLAYSAKTYLGGVAPYHWLDFINNRALYAGADVGNVTQATGYSFSRASQGYYTNADGTLTLFGYNLLLQSQTFGTTWTAQRTTVTENTIAAPDGTTTADTVLETVDNGSHGVFQAITKAASSITYALSCHIKPNGRDWAILQLDSAGETNRVRVWFDLTGSGAVGSNVAAGTGFSFVSASIQALANGWYRCVAVITGDTNTTYTSHVRPATADATVSYVGDITKGLYLWGAQLDQAAQATAYVPTTSAAAGALRRGDRGVLIEGSRTNIALHSQDFSNAAWVKANSTVTANAIAAPDGTLTADKLAASDTASNQKNVSQTVGSISTQYTDTVYAKAAEYGWLIMNPFDGVDRRTWFDLVNGVVGTTAAGATASIRALANGWYECSVTRTGGTGTIALALNASNADNVAVFAGAIGSGIYIWQADRQAAAFKSSPIPTTSASVTRASDVLTYTAGVSYGLSLWAEFERAVDTGGDEELLRCAFDGNERSTLSVRSSGDLARAIQRAGASDVADLTVGGALALNVVHKMAARFALNSVRLACAGTLSTEDTVAAAPTNPVLLTIATAGSTFGYIRRIAVIQGAGTDANLVSMTT